MPELPEAETIVRFLRPKIRGKQIWDMWSNTPRLFRKVKAGRSDFQRFYNFKKSGLQKFLRGRKILDICRKGKNIVLNLSGGHDLYIHLMMTGKLLWNPPRIQKKHIRFWIKLSGGDILALHDVRKFGWIRLLSKDKLSRGKPTLRIGPDALSLSFQRFKEVLGGRKGVIKPLILNQKIISGIGNIYADEILWYAGIKPQRPANALKTRELKKLHLSLQGVLRLAIRKGGTSSRDYRKPDGSEGGYYNIRKAYQRAGEKCSRCGGIIERMVIGQRPAYYCPKHQR